jgi:hypothetical protein
MFIILIIKERRNVSIEEKREKEKERQEKTK